jgi:hypothetical protein
MAASRYGAGLSVIRLTITGAVSLASLFVLCWAGAVATDVRLSHMFIELFTMAPIGSVTALAEGACWSFLFGALSGLLISFTYNLLSFLDTEGEAS